MLQIGMIPHNMTLFKFICVQYQFHCQTLPIMKIDRGQIQFREYVSTGMEPKSVFFWASRENKMAALASDWLRLFQLLL